MMEGVGLTTGTVQGQHQLAAGAFAVRGGLHCRFQFRHEVGVPTQGQIRVDAFLEHRQFLVRQLFDFGTSEIFIGKIGQGLAAPQRKRVPEKASGRPGIPCGQGDAS